MLVFIIGFRRDERRRSASERSVREGSMKKRLSMESKIYEVVVEVRTKYVVVVLLVECWYVADGRIRGP